MRIKTILISVLMLIPALASATPFTNTVDFSTAGTYNSQTYSIVNDLNTSSFVGEYSHTVNFDPAAASVDAAQLDLYYALATQQNGGDREVWVISDGGGVKIGNLTASTNSTLWEQKTFILGSNLLAGLSGSTWTIAFKFNESSDGLDQFYLDKSILSGEYTVVAPPQFAGDAQSAPVPEPATMMLLGTGFLGLAIYGKRRRS